MFGIVYSIELELELDLPEASIWIRGQHQTFAWQEARFEQLPGTHNADDHCSNE